MTANKICLKKYRQLNIKYSYREKSTILYAKHFLLKHNFECLINSCASVYHKPSEKHVYNPEVPVGFLFIESFNQN